MTKSDRHGFMWSVASVSMLTMLASLVIASCANPLSKAQNLQFNDKTAPVVKITTPTTGAPYAP
jgi:hypothetical protein